MSAEQIDVATPAVINITSAVDTYGPGVGLTVGVVGVVWAGRRIHDRIHTRMALRRRNQRDRASAWWTQCFNPPAIDTEAGHDTDDLTVCKQILRATTRKEKPRP